MRVVSGTKFSSPHALRRRETDFARTVMRLAFFFLLASASAAAAHPGHIAEVAGHAHWIGLAAAGAAATLAGWLAGKLSEDEPEEEEVEQEA